MSKKWVIALTIIVVFILAMIVAASILVDVSTKQLNELVESRIKEIDLQSLDDGDYVGEYRSLPIQVVVKVTIEAHRIVVINLITHRNGQGERGEEIIESVLLYQSVDIDSIAGATYSSKAILHAVYDALKQSSE